MRIGKYKQKVRCENPTCVLKCFNHESGFIYCLNGKIELFLSQNYGMTRLYK